MKLKQIKYICPWIGPEGEDGVLKQVLHRRLTRTDWANSEVRKEFDFKVSVSTVLVLHRRLKLVHIYTEISA